jgi:hypothetical protein
MSSMCARNGQEISHTRATLLFIVHHQIPTVMSKKHLFCAHTDGPRTRARWSAVYITTILGPDRPRCQKKLGPDSPPTMAGPSATWQLEAPRPLTKIG